MKTTLLLAASLGLCLVARAESPDSIPNPRDTNRSSIYDGAEILSDADKHRIDDTINAFEKRDKGQMMVVTVQTLDGMSIEEWSNTLFRRIGIGRKGKDDGVLFVFAIKDRKSRIEVGLGLEDKLTDARTGEIQRNSIRPAFRRGAYGAGIIESVNAAINIIEGRPTARPTAGGASSSGNSTSAGNGSPSNGSSSSPTSGSSSGASPSSYSPPSSSDGFSGGVVLLFVGAMVASGVGAAIYVARRPRPCPQCGAMGLTEAEARDTELNDAERVERHMGSRTFRRISCSKCGYSNIEKRDIGTPGLNIVRCSRCANRTARLYKRIISRPTYDYEGQEETTKVCEYPPCRYVDRFTRTVPPTPRPSPSSAAAGGLASGWNSSLDNHTTHDTSSSSSYDSSSSSSSYDGGSSSSYSGGDSGGGGSSSDW